MFDLSPGHLLILAIVVLLFGHRRLPELGNALGKGLLAFKSGLKGKDMDGKGPDEQEKLPPDHDRQA